MEENDEYEENGRAELFVDALKGQGKGKRTRQTSRCSKNRQRPGKWPVPRWRPGGSIQERQIWKEQGKRQEWKRTDKERQRENEQRQGERKGKRERNKQRKGLQRSNKSMEKETDSEDKKDGVPTEGLNNGRHGMDDQL